MTDAEALDMVRRIISGTVVTFPHPLVAREETFLIGDRNADVIISALRAAGWSWVLTRERAEWQQLRATGRTILDYPQAPIDE